MTSHIPQYERLLAIWQRMLAACTEATHADYAVHGARGIGVCDAWRSDAKPFVAWALTQPYAEDRFLVRIHLAGDFEPENCWWVDAEVYQRYLQYIRPLPGEGTVRPMGAWLVDPRCHVDLSTFTRLLGQGWTVECILGYIPPRNRRGRKYPFKPGDIPIGMVFGRLTVIGRPDVVESPSGWKHYVYPCRCACGTPEHRVYATNLLNGEVVSCGCYRREMRGAFTLTHGDARRVRLARLYLIWTRIIGACTKPRHRDYPLYGSLGIAVCLAWQTDYQVFRTWALAHGYREGLRIERHDRTGDFTPENCFFTDDAPLTSRSRVLTFAGESKTASEWARDPRCVVSVSAFQMRLAHGWTLEKALTEPQRRTDAKPIMAFGETHSLLEWSRDPRCRVPWTCLQGRLRNGWDAEEAMTIPSGEARPGLTAFGERKSLAAWARDPRCAVPEYMLARRIRQGWPVEAAITTSRTSAPRNHLIEAFSERKTIQEWAQDARCRVPLPTLRSRLKAGWLLVDALTTPANAKPHD